MRLNFIIYKLSVESWKLLKSVTSKYVVVRSWVLLSLKISCIRTTDNSRTCTQLLFSTFPVGISMMFGMKNCFVSFENKMNFLRLHCGLILDYY